MKNQEKIGRNMAILMGLEVRRSQIDKKKMKLFLIFFYI